MRNCSSPFFSRCPALLVCRYISRGFCFWFDFCTAFLMWKNLCHRWMSSVGHTRCGLRDHSQTLRGMSNVGAGCKNVCMKQTCSGEEISICVKDPSTWHLYFFTPANKPSQRVDSSTDLTDVQFSVAYFKSKSVTSQTGSRLSGLIWC